MSSSVTGASPTLRLHCGFLSLMCAVACGDAGGDGEIDILGAVPENADSTTITPGEGQPTPDVSGEKTGDDAVPQDPQCEGSGNGQPDTPTLLAPASGGIVDLGRSDFGLRASEFSDPDGDQAAASAEFELWTVKDDRLDVRVWHATRGAGSGQDVTSATLADGELVGPAAAGAIAGWQRYGARVRYTDDDTCPESSEWSAPVIFRADDGSSALFDQELVHDFHLTIPPESWDAIDAQALPQGCVVHERDYFGGALRFEEQTFEGVGVRVKGGCGSAMGLDEKAAFKVDLEWDDPSVAGCPAERHLYGQNKLTFNNMVQDPTFSRERLAYQLYRAMGIAVPRLAHVRLHVNGDYWGLYLLIESHARRMLARHYASNDGELYEGTYDCDLEASNVPTEAAGPFQATRCFQRKLVSADACDQPDPPQEVLDHRALLELIAGLDALTPETFHGGVGALVDLEQFLSVMAADGVTSNWDGHFSGVNNYRLYREPDSGLWSLLPSGMDQSLQGWRSYDPWSVRARFARACFESPECELAFAQRLEQAVAMLEGLDLAADLDRTQLLIADAVATDPRVPTGSGAGLPPGRDDTWWEPGGAEPTEDPVDNLRAWLLGLPVVMRTHMADHGF